LRRNVAPLCVITGALTSLTAAIGRVIIDPDHLAEKSGDPAVVINGVVALIASLLLVFVLIGLYERQGEGGGSLRASAFTVALAGTVLLAGDFWFEAFVVPYLADVAPAALDADPGGTLLAGAAVTFILFGVGWLLVGITSYRDASLPRAPVILVTAAALIGASPGSLGKVVFGIGLIWLGLSLPRTSLSPVGS